MHYACAVGRETTVKNDLIEPDLSLMIHEDYIHREPSPRKDASDRGGRGNVERVPVATDVRLHKGGLSLITGLI